MSRGGGWGVGFFLRNACGGGCFGENVFSGGIEGCKTEKYTYQETSATLSLSSEFQKRSSHMLISLTNQIVSQYWPV